MPATKRTVDFTNVKDAPGIRPRRMPAGDYLALIKDVNDHKTDKDPNQWAFTIELVEHRGASYAYYCGSSDEKLLWKIRNMFLACGIQVPKRRMGVDPNKLVGRKIGVTLEDDEYNGKEKSSIAGMFPADELTAEDSDAGAEDPEDDEYEDDEEELEEEPPPPARKTGATAAKKAAPAKAAPRRAKPAPVEEDEEDDEDLEIDDL